jgi:hypothetical protein
VPDTPPTGRTPEPLPNPRRVTAGRANRRRRGPLTEAGRARLRDRPWLHATGPRTAAGKAQAARIGKPRQRGPRSVREVRVELAEVRSLIRAMGEFRRSLDQP